MNKQNVFFRIKKKGTKMVQLIIRYLLVHFVSLVNIYSGLNDGSMERNLDLNLLNNKKIDDFALDAPGVVIPGQFLINVGLKIDIRSRMKVSISYRYIFGFDRTSIILLKSWKACLLVLILN